MEIGLLVVAAAVLDLAAGAGLAYVVGFGKVRAVLGDFQWGWIIALLVSAVGYYYAYRGVFRVDGGPRLPRRELLAGAIAGFGGHLAHGGGPLDQYALRAAGADEDQAKVRAPGRTAARQDAARPLLGGRSTGLARPGPDFGCA